MGSFVSRGLLMMFGYAYPAYECFKAVEKSISILEIEQLQFWCQYWILVAMLTVCERVGDNLISWLPLYSEAKLAFFIYLWHQKTKGTVYFYNRFFRPFVTKHETEIDHSLLEMRDKGGELALLYWEMAVTKFLKIFQCASSRSASQSHSDQQELNATITEPHVSDIINQPTKDGQIKESDAYSQQPQEPSSESEEMPNEPLSSIEIGNSESSLQETLPKETVQPRRGRWRLFHRAASH
ncbi:hypothetical protein GH714_030919 [Hevea brasiliensis]|uniref:HVA22-like protein n=1 Tax=Hevea brasiliensis TaxID=3981 RepID=A0A6A6LLS4_HEVBR|nr:hypothetical protein GH714_030919 [Hevea brasiliensis]